MSSGRPAKRRRREVGIGAPSEADSPVNQINAPSSTAYATRRIVVGVLPLTSMCLSVFVRNFAQFLSDPNIWEGRTKHQVQALPDSTIPRLLRELASTCPSLLASELVRDSFLRGPAIILSSDFGGTLNKSVVAAIPSLGHSVHSLSLTYFEKIEDVGFAKVVSALPALQSLNLRGCIRVGQKTVEAVARQCPSLTSINLSYTSVLPLTLLPLLRARRETLKVMKTAIPTWTDASFAKLLDGLRGGGLTFLALETVKLRQTALSDVSLNGFLAFCPNVRRLDISFTRVRRLSDEVIEQFDKLEKLTLTSTNVASQHLCYVLLHAPRLSTLNIGALGGQGQGQQKALIIGSTALTLTDDALSDISDTLADRPHLTSVNLVGNSKLGQRRGPITKFIQNIGRGLRNLNLTGLSLLRSGDLSPLLSEDPSVAPPALQVLSLNRTGVNDEAAQYIASCESLQVLEVSTTRFSEEGLFSIIDNCPLLSKIDLTSCRSIGVAARRQFFEVH
ncbi:hypothetical protein K488DRAFT_40679 [Vararia minispora EC-137]|uniref:Uncharacterized protein n=1 Tax=Vararia minispora EC-137 TaxID=1314806 RepID=A0ACB8QYT6_9AGAM|nr:hypothetical protein K488DRAFT_40679 [Vararia minispora EC-137]